MTNIWKRSISMLLALVMVVGMLPVQAFATETEQGTEAASVTEPVVVETTAPVVEEIAESSQATEETSAPEPVPEETVAATESVAETTEAAEVVQETTAPAETEAVAEETTETVEEPVEETEPAEEAQIVATRECYNVVPSVELPDDEELFAAYAEQQFYGEIAAFGTAAGRRLTGDEKLAYDALVPVIKQIANGERASAKIALGVSLGEVMFGDGSTGVYNADVEVAFNGTTFPGDSLHRVVNALMTDMPYEMYWYDKTIGVSDMVIVAGSQMHIVFEFAVAGPYMGGDLLTANTAKTGAAKNAAANAKAVVDSVAADPSIKTDYDKLIAYRDWICANVAYNTSAADGGNFSENADPWQLIYVFDGNAATNVVCEGYAKAFQYLCDLTEFDADVYCYSVTGVMAGGTGAGGHMWNILEIDGKHYLVDVTNSDSGTVGAGGGLFLVGGTPNADGSYTFIGVNFAYDDNTREQWVGTDVLTLDTVNYKPVQAGGSNAEAALREGLAASVGKEYIMNDSVTLTEDLTINLRSEEDPWLIGFGIGHGATLTVPSGVTLTVISSMWIEGELILEDGATLVVGKANDQYGTGVNLHGKLTAASGATVKLNNSGNIYVYDGATVSGVSNEKLIRERTVYTLAELKSAMTLTGYRQVQAFIDGNVTLAETLTIPVGFNVYCLNSDESFTIANGGHLIVDGFFSVQNGATLNIHAGGIMTINGNAISYGGILNNNGTINGYFQVNSAGGQELSEADFITAMENCNGYYNLVDHVVITGDVTIPDNVCVWVTDTGSLTVAQGGKLTVSENGQLSTGNSRIEINGTLVNNGYMSLDFSGDGGEIKIASAGKYQNNGNLFVGSGTLALDGTYTGGSNAWVRYDSNATITNMGKIGKENIYLQDVVHTEAELIAAMVVKDGYKGQSVSINDDITLTKNLVIPGNIHLEIGYSWRSEEENQYGLTLANGVTLTNEFGISVGEKFYLHINNGATLVNYGYVDVYGSYVCNGTVTGNAVQINGGTITQDAFEQMLAAAGENWVNMGQQVTLERNLTIDNNFSVNGPEGSIVVPSGVILTVNGFMGVMGQVTVEAGGKIVMGENANIHVDGEGSLTFESGANLSGLRKGQIHYYPAYGATINGLDNSYVELSVGVDTMAELKAALSNTDSSYHSTHIEIRTPFDIAENIVIPANVCLSILNYLEGGMVNMTLSGNLTNKGSFEIDYGVKLTVTGSLNNDGNVNVYEEGTLYVANGGSLTNNGGLRNYGGTIIVDGAYENKGHVEGDVTVNGASSVTDALQKALEECAANGQDYVCSTTFTLDKDLTVNLNGGTFKIEEGGMIVVPNGVKLTVESNVQLNGGKLVVLDGGWVQTVNGAMINAEMGVFFVETGAKYDIRANWAVIEAEGDAQTSLVAYNCNDYGSGVAVDWRYPGTAVHIMPGMWYQGLFCIREFNKTNYEWHNTIIRADELTKGEHLTAMALADTENPPVFAGDDEYAASYAVAVIADRVFAESHLSYTLRGVTYTIPVTIGPGNMGFFSQPVATAENYLGLGYTINPDAAENSFYYMFFGDKDGWKIDSFQIVNNPFDMQPVDQVTWTKVSDTVYKITVKPECWGQSFPVHVQVGVSNANYGLSNTWGIGQLWVESAVSFDPWLGFVWLDGGDRGWYEKPDEPSRMDGMWAQDEFYGVFYLHQWNESKQQWVGTPIIPTETSDYVTITPVKNLPGHTILAGEANANYFVQVKGTGPLEGISGGKLNFTCNGVAMSQDFDLYPCDVAWYDANETTLDAFLSTGGAEVVLDYSGAENAYYLKLLDPSKYTIKNFSWGVNTWGEDYDQYVSDGEFITMTDLGNGTFKFTVDPEFVALTKYTWKNFCLYADVRYENAAGNRGGNWHGEIWVNPPEGEFHEPDAELFIDGQVYAFFDGLSYPMRWIPTGDFDDQGREIMKLVKAELPAGVSYDLGSNKLRLNNATLQNLEVSYYRKDENGRPLPAEEFGSRIPNPNFFLELKGTNIIDCDDERAAILIRDGANLNVVGDGTLELGPGKLANGKIYGGIEVAPDANATFQSGTILADTVHFYFNGIAEWGGTTLIGNATGISANNTLIVNSGNITLNGGVFDVHARATMNGGTIVLNSTMLYQDVAFEQNGGTITINDNNGNGPSLVVANYYAMNGGELNINQNTPWPGLSIEGTFHQMGGSVNIKGVDGSCGVKVNGKWDEDGNPETDGNGKILGGSLLLNDGVMSITGVGDSRIAGIDVNGISSAFFGGGTLNLTNAHICNGGEITMTHMTEDSVMTVNLNNANFYADNTFNMYGGELYINNGIMIVNAATGIHSGRLVINNSGYRGLNGLIVNNYFFLPAESNAYIQATSSGVPAIVVDGTYHQMGGLVFAVAQNGGQAPGMLSNGATLINGGELYAIGEIGFIQEYNFDWNNPNGQPGMMITGGTMRAEGDNLGFWVKGPVMWNGGTVKAHTNATVDSLWQSAVQVDCFTGDGTENVSFLEINDGEHSLTADPSTTGRETYGLAIEFAPVTINGGMVNIDAEQALWSMTNGLNESNISSETGVVTYLSMDSGEYLDIHGELGADYYETLLEADGSYAGNVLISVSTDGKAPMTQGRLEAMLREAAANGTGVVLEENLTLVRDLELNAHLTIKNNAQLIVPAGVTLTNKEDRVLAMVSGGSLSVSGDLVNHGYLNVGEYQQASLAVSGTLTNYGVFRVFKDGTAEIGGYLKNIRPDDLTQQRGLVIAYGVLNAAEVYNSRWICAWGGTINITGRLENAGELSHDDGGKITVDTVMNYNDAILNVFNGHLTVTNVLNNNGEIHANQGSINVNGRYIHGEYAVVYYANYDGTAITINGIGPGYQTMTYNGSNASQLVAMLNECGNKGYGKAMVYITGNMTLPQDLKFSDNVKLWVQGSADAVATLTVPAGKTMELHGNLVIEKTGAVDVQGTLKNYGGIHVHGNLLKQETAAVFNGTFMNVYAGGRVHADGDGWSGYDPWKIDDSAIIEGTAMGMTQTKFEHWLAEAERVGYAMELSQVVTLNKNLTINADVTITNGGGIVVPKGITLTINSKRFEVNEGGSLIVDGTLVNNTSIRLYKGAGMDVNKDAVLNNTWATVENSSCIWVDGGELNISGTLNNSAHVSVYNGGVINVMAAGMFKNIFSGKYSPTLAVDGNGTLNLMGTIVNDGIVETWGSNAKLLSYAGSKLTNNATLRNDTQDATMDLSQTQYIHGTNATVHSVYFENGSVSTIQGIPNEKILLHVDMQMLNLSGASQESVVNAFSKYGYDNGYQGQIVHYFGVNEINEDVVLQPSTKLLVHQGWGRYGDPDPGHLTLNANVEIMEGASIDVYHTSGTKLTIGENAHVVNRGNLTVFEGTELVIDGNLDTHPGSTLNVLETAKLTINKSAAVVNSGVLGGEKGSYISIDGYVGNYRGEMYALGTYELSKNGEIRNSAYNGTMSVMSGFQAKDLHLDAYFTEGATAANLTSIINTIKTNGYISGEVTVFTDMTLNTLEIPANVTLHIYGEDYNGQVVSTTTVTVNGQLTNMGKIQEHRGGKLVMNGTLVGMPPVDESGNTDFISQAELEQMLAESQHVTLNKRVIVSGELEISGTLNIVDGGELTIAKGGTVNLTGRMELFRDDSGTTPGMLNVQTGGKLVNNGEIVFHQPANEKAGPVVDVKGTYVHGITNTGENAVVWSNYVEGNAPAINGIVKSYQTLNCVTTQEVRLNEFFTFANGYGAAEVSVTGDLTLQNNLVIPVNGKLCVTAGTLTIPEGVTLSNWGAMEISEDGHLVVEGTILGNEPVVGTENTNIISLSQFKQELAETAVSGQPYNLTKRVIVTENMTLSEGMKLNIIGGELVVTNNATFTNNGVISTSTNNGGAVVVEEGSKFVNNSELHVGSDGVKMAPGSYVHGEQAMLYVDYTDSGDGCTVANIEGVDKSYQILLFKRDGMWSAPAQRFFDVAQGYRGGLMKLIGGMTVEQELTVPANVTIRLGDDAFCELRITADLTNNGTIVLASGSSMSMDDCWLNNYGKLEINGNADLVGTVDNYGQLVNRGTVNGEGTIYSVPGGVTNAGSIHCRLVYNAYVTTEAELLNAVAAGVQFVLVEKDLTLTKPFTIPADVEICIREDVTVTVNMNGNITNHGRINVYGKIVFVKGDVDGYKVNVFDGGKIENAPEDSFVLVGVQPASFEFTADKLVAPTGVPVDLFVKNVQPIGADYVEYAFEILDYDPDKAYIDQDTNMLYGWDEGPVTVRAKLILGYDENNEPIYSDITADVTVNFVIQGAYFDFPVTADDENGPVLYSGDRVVLNGEMRQLHEVTETDENGEEITRIEIGELSNMTGAKIVWELEEDDDAYATLSVSGNKATITAKNVTERQSVTVRAMAEDDSAWTFSQSFTILPKLEKTALYTGGLDVTGKTITFDVNVQDAADLVMDMDLLATPMDALNDTLWFNTKSGWLPAVTWSSSDESIAWVGDNGALNFTGAVGTVKVTATTNGSVKKSATVTINVIETPDEIEIVEPVTKLIGSQSATYKAQGVFRKTDGTEEKIGLLNTAVKWNLVDENGNVVANDPYAVITADGKLTTKAVEAPYTISLRAEYTIGDTVKETTEQVTLYPDVNNIEILDGTVVVNNETLLNDLGADYRQMTLAVKGYPANGSIKEVQWKSSNAKVADIDAEGKITATGEPGTVTFTATAIDHKGTRKTATVKVTYAVLVKEICLMDEAGNPISENLSLRAGETFAFGYTAKASGEEWVPGNTNVTWTVSDTTAAGIQGTKLSAKAVNNPVKVTVTAAAKDGSNVSASCTVTILPKQADALLLYTGTAEEPVYVTKTTQLVEYNKEAPVSIQLNANDAVTWATSNAKIADVDAPGKVTVLGSGMATITAKTADGRSATVTIKGSKLSDKVEITAKNSLDVKELVVASGKSLNLTGTVLYTDGSKDAQVTWVVTDAAGNATSAAKISASGALSATANLNKTVVVYVQAMAKDGIAVSEKVAVTIKALATGVQIKNEKGEILNNLKLNWDFGGNGKEELKLSAAVISDEACQSVKWTSSGKTVADVDETGKITFLKAGTVTITATATDGSNKKATVTLVVSKLMTSLTMNQEKPIVVLGNKSLKLAPYAIVDTEATNQKLTWEILSGSDFASINATGGDLRAKDVTQMQTVTVQATAADGSGLKATATVTIYPATTKVEIWTREDKNFLTDVTGKTITMFDEEVLHLGAKTVPFDTMMNDGTAQWLWTSSDMTGSVVVDQNGVVTVIGGGVTATITAKALDGTNKTATIKIQTIQPVERITFEHGMFLAGGMSLDLSKKVTFNDGGIQPTNKKLTWEIAREDASYASINANGMLKANKIDVQKTITVYAMATDGSNVYGSAEIALWPAATKIQIADSSNSAITKNVPMYLKNGPVSTTLNVLTDPAGAMQTMKWTVAAMDQKFVTLVDDYGNEVAEYVGAQATVMAKVGGKTITITASTMDGTNKRATVRVQTFQLVNDIRINDQVLAGGLSLSLNTKASVNADATNKKLTWEFVTPADQQFATLSNGTLRAAKRNDKAQPVTVMLRATAEDYGKFSKTVAVTILPATTKLQIMDNGVDMTNQTIDLYLGGAAGMDRAVLDIQTTPAAAMQQVMWSVAARDRQYVTLVDGEGNAVAELISSRPVVKALVGGKTVTLTAASLDGTNKKVNVKIKTTQLVTDLAIEDQILAGGLSLNLGTKIVFNEGGEQPTSKKVAWNILSGGDYASINATTGMLTAKRIDTVQKVRVQAVAQDGSGVDGTCVVTIYPATTALNIRNAGVDVTNKTIDLYLGSGQGKEQTELNIQTTPAAAMKQMKWTVAERDQQYVTLIAEDGSETAEYIGSEAVVRAKVGGKTVTVTAMTLDGTNKRATVRVKTTQLVTDMTLADLTLGSGLSLNLTNLLTFNANGAQPTSKKVTWSVISGGAYASINASTGLLKAEKLDGRHTVTVLAAAQDGSGVTQTCTVTILPATTNLQILQGEENVTNKTVKLFLGGKAGEDLVYLNALVAPINAMKQVKWSVAAADQAYVELDETFAADGVIAVKAIKGGRTVTLTAAAQDGSNKRATVRIQTVQLMEDMRITGQPIGNTIHVAAGKTMTLKVDALPTTTANKNVTWSVVGGEGAAYVTLNANGSLAVSKDLTKRMSLTIRATAKDEGALTKDFHVELYPQITLSIRLTAARDTIGVGDELKLKAKSLPYVSNVKAAQAWLWTSSNTKIAVVDEDGVVKGMAAGSATITCKAVDGSGKTATFKITVK